MALHTRKYIVTSNLPTFKETLCGFDEDLFFEKENPEDLARVIGLYLDNKVNFEHVNKAINNLNELYSWSQSANATYKLYSDLTQSI